MWVLLDCKPVYGADGEKLESNCGPRGTYVLGGNHRSTAKSTC
jgi:hypothetical protein